VEFTYEYILIDTAAGTHCNVINALIGVESGSGSDRTHTPGKARSGVDPQFTENNGNTSPDSGNKADMGDLNLIHQLSQGSNFPIIQEIPYEKDIMKKHSRNQPVTHDSLKKLADSISNLSIVGGEE
jgi:MinD superfamily P-loop ATPase